MTGSPDSVGGRSTLCQSAPTTGCLERNHRVVVCANQCSRRYDGPGATPLVLTRSTDYRTLLSLLPESSAQRLEINRTLKNMEPRIENQRKKETGEMMGKLKELGNTLLGLPHDARPWDKMLTKFHRQLWSLNRQFQFRTEWTRGIFRELLQVIVAFWYFISPRSGRFVGGIDTALPRHETDIRALSTEFVG